MAEFTDETPMSWGKFEGQKLANIPATYLLWLYDQPYISSPSSANNQKLKHYIKENYDVLLKQSQEEAQRQH